MSEYRQCPPLDASLPPIPGFVDFQAKHNGDRPWTVFPPGASVPSISFLEFADATNRVAHVFRPDGTRANGEIVALIIHCDSVLYVAMLAGLIRAGYIPFPMSPKNSIPAFMNLFGKTSCHNVISQPAFASTVDALKSQLAEKQFELHVQELPCIYSIFPMLSGTTNSRPVEPFPPPSKPHSKDDIVLYLHSSGSTGFPKAIAHRQSAAIQWCSIPVLMETRKRGLLWGSMAQPTFHTIGIYMQLYLPLVTSHPIALYPPMYPSPPVVPTPANVLEVCKAVGANAIPTVPTFVEAWAQSEDTIKYLASSMKLIAQGGGPLSDKHGGKLASAGVPLYAVYGGTEYGVHTLVFDIDDSQGPEADVKTSADWDWMRFADYVNCRWIPQGDGTYELQFLTCPTHCPSVENLPDVRGYATSDLFIPHPTKPGLWKIAGRKDDVIVLQTGEKVVPIPQEGIITSSPVVTGAAMFGRGRNSCGVLIEPHLDYAVDVNEPEDIIAFRNKIWPVVDEANQLAPTFARIYKEMILVTDPARPLPRAAKGTVVRSQAANMYANEIDKLYETVADSADTRGVSPPASWLVDEVEAWLVQLCASINNGKTVLPSRDMFEQGFDSLHATFLRNRFLNTLRCDPNAAIQHAAARISQNFVFEHPTVHGLAEALVGVVASGPQPSSESHTEDEVQRMLHRYGQNISRPHYTESPPGSETVVLLTGSTGNVGSHILSALLEDSRIRKVYTLNRPSASSETRQASAFKDRGLPVALLSSPKLVQLFGDTTAEALGLTPAVFDEVKDVTHIIHNAWRVDFNLSLASFEKHIAGTRRLVDLCCGMSRPVKLFFTSSVGAAHNWDINRGPVPEEVLVEENTTVSGYGASKFVGENILLAAMQNGVPCTSLRIGQVCGSQATGAWGTSEWVPIIVKSSVTIGMLPELDGLVSWIPMDAVATMVLDLVTSSAPLPPLVNVVHPRPTSWKDVFQNINLNLDRTPLRLVPFDDWLRAVEDRAVSCSAKDLERLPALKVLQFLRGIATLKSRAAQHACLTAAMEAGGSPAFATDKLQEYCPSMRTLRPIGEEHAKAWVGYWKAQGFLRT